MDTACNHNKKDTFELIGEVPFGRRPSSPSIFLNKVTVPPVRTIHSCTVAPLLDLGEDFYRRLS